MLLYFPKLNEQVVKALREAGFESIKDYFADIVKLKYALAKQEAHEFIAASLANRNSSLLNKTKTTKTSEKEYSKTSYFKQEQWTTLKQQIKPDYQAWYKTQRQQLNDKTWWETLKAKNKECLSHYLTWNAQDKYKYYRSESIVFIYNTVLPVFTHWLEYAQAELNVNQHTLKPPIKQVYTAFLKELKDFINAHKNALRTSMLTRLMAAADQNDLRFDDVTVATLNALEAIGAIDKTEKPSMPQRGMTPHIFYSFINTLQEEGTWGEAHAVKDLPYFKPTPAVTPKTFHNKLGKKTVALQFLVPAVCADFIPKQTPFYLKLPQFLHGLFAGTKLRYEFFQDKTAQYLLASFATIEKLAMPATLTLAHLHQLPLFHDVHYFEMLVYQEQQRLAHVSKRLSGAVYKKEHAMVARYDKHLKNVGANLMFKKVDLLETIIRQYETCANRLTKQEKINLQELLDEIKADQKNWGIHFKFSKLEKHCYMSLLSDKPVTELTQKDTNQIEAQTEKEKIKKMQLETFEAEIVKNPLALSLTTLKAHSQTLQAAFTNLTIANKSLITVNAINKQIYQYIYQFIHALCELDSKESYLGNAEKITVILALLKTFSHDNQALQAVVANLEKAQAQIHEFDWPVIVEFKLIPEKIALMRFLNNQCSQPLMKYEQILQSIKSYAEDCKRPFINATC